MRRRARTWFGMVAAAVYAAALFAFGLPGLSGANHTVNVSTEQEYRDALTDLPGGDTSPHTINVIADITIDDGTDPTYAGTEPLTINGNGFTLDAGSTSRVLFHVSIADLTIDGLTVTGGDDSGGIGGSGGGIFASGSVTVTNSTITGNTASGGTGGSGGGIFTTDSVTVTNSTITGNTASGGTAGTGGGIFGGSSMTLTHATVVENSAPISANLRTLSSGLTSFGSVVALPQGGGANCTVSGGTTSQGYNYSDDASCGFTGTGDTQGGPDDPQLGALANNGGPTQTMLPLTGSPLIDAIPVADCDEEVTDDQRGVDRPQDGNDDGTFACDIGAVEVEGPTDGNGNGNGNGGAPAAEPVEGAPSFTG